MLDFVFQSNNPGLNLKSKTRISLPYRTASKQARKEIYEQAGWSIRHLRREWPKWAWPGCYPIFYVTRDNGVLSADSANENLKLTLGDDPQWEIVAFDINYENPRLFCDHSGKRIESVYAEDAAEAGVTLEEWLDKESTPSTTT